MKALSMAAHLLTAKTRHPGDITTSQRTQASKRVGAARGKLTMTSEFSTFIDDALDGPLDFCDSCHLQSPRDEA